MWKLLYSAPCHPQTLEKQSLLIRNIVGEYKCNYFNDPTKILLIEKNEKSEGAQKKI